MIVVEHLLTNQPGRCHFRYEILTDAATDYCLCLEQMYCSYLSPCGHKWNSNKKQQAVVLCLAQMCSSCLSPCGHKFNKLLARRASLCLDVSLRTNEGYLLLWKWHAGQFNLWVCVSVAATLCASPVPPTVSTLAAQPLPRSPEDKCHKVDWEEGCLEVDCEERLVIIPSEEILWKKRHEEISKTQSRHRHYAQLLKMFQPISITSVTNMSVGLSWSSV